MLPDGGGLKSAAGRPRNRTNGRFAGQIADFQTFFDNPAGAGVVAGQFSARSAFASSNSQSQTAAISGVLRAPGRVST